MSNIKTRTPNFKFLIPEFNAATWHDELEQNFRSIDALFYNLFGINGFSGTWKPDSQYTAGQVLFVGEDNGSDYEGRLIKIIKDTNTGGFNTFSEAIKAKPNDYELFADDSTSQMFAELAKDWADKTDGTVKTPEGEDTGKYSAKYHAQVAAQHEINCKSYKNQTATYLTAAEEAKTSATNQAQIAQQQASSATTSATNAKTSETKAKTSENTAITQANLAKQYADRAQSLTEGSLNRTQISNCITEIPQDINLILSNGTLILKAGSKVYVPKGNDKFDAVTISSDITAGTPYTNAPIFLYYYNGAIQQAVANAQQSGSSYTISGGFWYDTTNNYVRRINSGSVAFSGVSFPIGIVSATNGSWSNIDQVFNGFGYIGSTVFALPGVKGLIPNGRNEDGSLKNIEFTLTSVRTATRTSSYTSSLRFVIGSSWTALVTKEYYLYDEKRNYNIDSNGISLGCVCGSVYCSDITLSDFKPKTPFHAVDYNDFENLDNKFEKLDSENVKLTGTQNVAGAKSFTTTNGLKAVTSGSNNVIIKDTTLDTSASTRTTLSVSSFSIYDKNDKIGGMFATIFDTNGTNQARMQIRNYASGSQVNGEITVSVDKNGNVFTNAPTPPSAVSNSLAIATTAWCTNASKDGNLFGAPNNNAAVTATGESYTAPSNGWYSFCVNNNGQAENGFYYIYINGNQIALGNGYGTHSGYTIALKKGDKIELRKSNATTVFTPVWARFIPCL